jgi:hypothetical protein
VKYRARRRVARALKRYGLQDRIPGTRAPGERMATIVPLLSREVWG